MKCFCSFFFLFTPLCQCGGKVEEICNIHNEETKNWHTNLSAVVCVCNAFGSRIYMRCYNYLKKTAGQRHMQEREKKCSLFLERAQKQECVKAALEHCMS